MSCSRFILFTSIAVLSLGELSHAACPDPANSTCTYVITQNPARPVCISGFAPDVIRLCPGGDWDVVTFNLTVRDAGGAPCVGTTVKPFTASGPLNLATGGYTMAVTDAMGNASLSVSAGSGCGILSICADDGSGVAVPFGCRLEARSPDVNKGSTPLLCGLSTSMSCVQGADVTNPACGFLVSFGSVTPGVNNCWDLNCDNNVNAADITGTLGKGGVTQHAGHCGTLGPQELCP
jgi:hypothetical protein